jgi:hypothetical protein
MTTLLSIIIFAVTALGVILTAALAAVFTMLRFLHAQQGDTASRLVAAQAKIEALNRNDFTLLRKVKAMAANLQSVSDSLTKAQKTLDAIVAANPQPQQDLSGLQNQADSLVTATTTVAAALGVVVPPDAPAAQ